MKNISNTQRWSALLVTIMITSIVLIVAMVLLEKIVPYSRQIRSMQDSLQAYYTARSEVELWKLALRSLGTRTNIDPDNRISGSTSLALGVPDLESEKTGAYLIVAQGSELPITLQLFKKDAQKFSFGTYPWSPLFHSLNASNGGIMFDLSGTDIGPGFSLGLKTNSSTTNKEIAMEFLYSDETEEIPFFWNASIASDGSVELMDAKNENAWKLQEFLAGKNCRNNHCSMKIRLAEDSANSLPIQISTKNGSLIPDLNSILVADGLSTNALYHSRIIELIPVTQSI